MQEITKEQVLERMKLGCKLVHRCDLPNKPIHLDQLDFFLFKDIVVKEVVSALLGEGKIRISMMVCGEIYFELV
jgi:hypothetical protein